MLLANDAWWFAETGGASLAETLAGLDTEAIEDLLGKMEPDEAERLQHDWSFWARQKQLPPREWLDGEKPWHLIQSGRGWGKTRIGAETTNALAEAGEFAHGALIAPTTSDVRRVMVEGVSGIVTVSKPTFRPHYEPSKYLLTYPNGVELTTFSADKADRLRGPEHDYVWADEIAAWRYPSAWDNMLFGLRLEAPTGSPPRLLATTTPRPVRIVRDLLADPATTVTRGSSYENRANLSPAYYATNIRKYEGTRLGLQEIHGQLLEDVPGALWNRAIIDATRGSEADETGTIVFKLKSGIYGRTRLRNMVRFALAIDPAVTSTEVSNETGMVWGARGSGDFSDHAFILGDLSGLHPAMGDDGWPQIAVRTYHEHRLDKVVAETNNGGDLVEATMRAIDRDISYKSVWASRGKRARAEPISAIYDEGRVHHIGSFPDLEDEQCTYVPDQTSESPNRVDAVVWLLTHLLIDAPSTSDAGNYALLKR